jgi:hypothetical protein
VCVLVCVTWVTKLRWWCAAGGGSELLSCDSGSGMVSPLSGKRGVVCLVCKSGLKGFGEDVCGVVL